MRESDSANAGEQEEDASLFSSASRTMTVRQALPGDFLSTLRFVSDLLAALPAAPTEPSLLFRARDRSVHSHSINAGLNVGRSEDCGISFPGLREMSREHFKIVTESGNFLLFDLASSNGTAVRGLASKLEPLKAHSLIDGDVIEAGGISFVFIRP